jgi:iron-sulfur cluster repair protein YtfE (RIC family)
VPTSETTVSIPQGLHTGGGGAAEPGAPRVTAPLRAARRQILQALAALAERLGELPSLPLEERAGAMRQWVAELDERLRPHLEFEERTIHPVVDKFACEGPATFSASMRYEHTIIYRWLSELARSSEDASAAVAFSRRADNLLGVVLAHFELEEEVLFPILDRTMSGASGHAFTMPPPPPARGGAPPRGAQ